MEYNMQTSQHLHSKNKIWRVNLHMECLSVLFKVLACISRKSAQRVSTAYNN